MESLIYTGTITISKIENFHSPESSDKRLQLTEKDISFVHYPDCQQLILYLPEPVLFYNSICWNLQNENSTWMNQPIENVSSGPAKLVIDTLTLPPGNGEICLLKNEAVVHKISFIKNTPEEIKSAGNECVHSGEYRDGTGRILPQEDLIYRAAAIEKIRDQFISKLTYYSIGRDGYIIFSENDKTIRFDYEMGGGNCLIFILIPVKEKWEEKTNFPISERERILEHLARMTQRDYIGGAPFSINDDCIVFYKNKSK